MTGAAWGFMLSIWAIIFSTIGISMSSIIKDK